MTKAEKIQQFQNTVWDFYKNSGRHNLPWRPPALKLRKASNTLDPYKILVSEIMLQQTQVDRVIPKYKAFIQAFPTIAALAAASNLDVLKLWSGLGYNRRALFLKRAAEFVTHELGGEFPRIVIELETLPGVGPYTARAIATFAYNQPIPFIETNIRSLFLHTFFATKKSVTDAELFPLIEKCIPLDGRAREWGWALMDYGSYIKKTVPNPSKRSKHHSVQSKFEGSLRQVRGAIMKYMLQQTSTTQSKITAEFSRQFGDRVSAALRSMVNDGLITIDARGRVTIS